MDENKKAYIKMMKTLKKAQKEGNSLTLFELHLLDQYQREKDEKTAKKLFLVSIIISGLNILVLLGWWIARVYFL